MTIYNNIAELIGNTPLLKLNKLTKFLNLQANLYAKLEMFNPAGSIKDRVALSMIETALANGIIKAGSTIIEPTSGNTGIGLALVAKVYDLKLILTMPDSMSVERRQLLKARGAQLVLTPGKEGMQGAVNEAKRLQQSIPGSFIVGQFDNTANPKIHENTTALEIYNDLQGKVDFVVAGVGTGGTISGIAKGLKDRGVKVTAIAVEPAESPLLSSGKAGPHKIQGIGANFVPQNYNATVIDTVMPISGADAYKFTKLLNDSEGVLAGISAGANLAVGIQLAQDPANQGKNIVVILPDTGEHYLSVENLF